MLATEGSTQTANEVGLDAAGPAQPDACIQLVYVPDVEMVEPIGGGRCGVYRLVLDGVDVGAVSLVGLTRCHGEIGYEIDPGYQGRGLATFALKRVVATVQPDHGFTLLTARAMIDNLASIRVLEKAGFTRASAKLCCIDGFDEPVGIVTYRRETGFP